MDTRTLARIDRRQHEALLAGVERFHLDAHPELAGTVAALKQLDITSTNRADLLIWTAVQEKLAPYETFHATYPYPVAPPGVLDGRAITTGLCQEADGQAITLDIDEFGRSGLLPGPTGEGKSTLAITLCRAARQVVRVFVIDPKKDDGFRALVARDDDFLILEPSTPLNLLAPDDSLSITEHKALLVDVGAMTLFGGEDYKAVMTLAYDNAFAKHAEPTQVDVVNEIKLLQSKGETYKFRDAQRGAQLRHQRIIDRYTGWHTSGGAPLAALFERSIYFPLTTVTEVEDFLITYLLRRLFHFRQRHA